MVNCPAWPALWWLWWPLVTNTDKSSFLHPSVLSKRAVQYCIPLLQFGCINLNKCWDRCSWMFRGSCECCLHDLHPSPSPYNPISQTPLQKPSRLRRKHNHVPSFILKKMLILEDHFNECMKLVCKSEGAINATSPLIDSEYLGKFEMLGMNMKCSLIQSEKMKPIY